MMGENCYAFLMDIAGEQDVCMGISASTFFEDSDLKGRKVHFANYDTYVDNALDFTLCVFDAEGNGLIE